MIAIISDNYDLASYMIEIIRENNTQFKLYYSSVNTNPNDMIALNAEKINLKIDSNIDFLMKNDIVFSLHCKQIFPKKLTDNVCCINIHPGFNPFNRGWYPQAFSVVNKLPVGATIHLMNEKIDDGNIIDQEEVEIKCTDTSLEVYRKIIELEKFLIRKNLKNILNKTFTSFKPEFSGNYNSIKDYEKMCKLDLNHVGTLQEHIDLLRALTHGNFNNAYFLDKFGEKNYVKISFN